MVDARARRRPRPPPPATASGRGRRGHADGGRAPAQSLAVRPLPPARRGRAAAPRAALRAGSAPDDPDAGGSPSHRSGAADHGGARGDGPRSFRRGVRIVRPAPGHRVLHLLPLAARGVAGIPDAAPRRRGPHRPGGDAPPDPRPSLRRAGSRHRQRDSARPAPGDSPALRGRAGRSPARGPSPRPTAVSPAPRLRRRGAADLQRSARGARRLSQDPRSCRSDTAAVDAGRVDRSHAGDGARGPGDRGPGPLGGGAAPGVGRPRRPQDHAHGPSAALERRYIRRAKPAPHVDAFVHAIKSVSGLRSPISRRSPGLLRAFRSLRGVPRFRTSSLVLYGPRLDSRLCNDPQQKMGRDIQWCAESLQRPSSRRRSRP